MLICSLIDLPVGLLWYVLNDMYGPRRHIIVSIRVCPGARFLTELIFCGLNVDLHAL